MKKALLVLLCMTMVVSFAFSGGQKDESSAAVKAGFIYVGPTGDYGWSYAHHESKEELEAKYPWFETVYVESVPEGDAIRIIDRLVQEEKCNVIFTTSFGYMDDTYAAAEKYPDVKFMHCSGFKQLPNMGTYFGDLYQMYYLNGMMAGALTKTNKLGYVAAFPIPELIRHINAFALGAKAVNPDAEVNVRWIYSWYGPDKAREAAEALITDGCDALAFTEDTPAVIEVGQEHFEKGDEIYTFSHYSPMQVYGVDSVVSGQLANWTVLYEKIITDIYEDKWSNYDLLWLLKEDAVELGGSWDEKINPKYVDALKAVKVDTPDMGNMSVYDLIMKRYEQMAEGREVFEPYSGPLYDNEGNLKIAEGEIAPLGDLMGIMYYVDGVVGSIPQQ
ncbi:MAG: BMP family ABC transporter substrate-binding protein [Spirochaetales bacterium]|nr:BMP family ABC transporter substrate-binding protein [Spirochaetales bacterium]